MRPDNSVRINSSLVICNRQTRYFQHFSENRLKRAYCLESFFFFVRTSSLVKYTIVSVKTVYATIIKNKSTKKDIFFVSN